MPTIEVDAQGQANEQHEIVPSVSIDNLLNQRATVLRLFRQAVDALTEAHATAVAAHIGFPDISLSKDYRGNGTRITGEFSRQADVFALFQAVVDAGAWRYLMDESGMKSLMSATKRDEFDQQLRGETIPELTREAIHDTFGALHAARGDMFDQGVIECFKHLSWRYKTNLPQKFGKRIIVTYLCSYGSPNHSTTSQLDDLMRVFHVIDGKPEADHRHGCYALVSAAMREQQEWPKNAENDYIAVRLFRNENGHVTFKRPDLIDKLNRIIAKHFPNALPAPR